MNKVIGDIAKKHHVYLKETLPELEKLVFTIFRVHFLDSGETLEKLHRTFGKLKAELEIHMIRQERRLFFAIKDYEDDKSQELLEIIKKDVETTTTEMDGILYLLKEIREITSSFTLPESSCATYERTYDKLQELEENIETHFEEENKLFSPFK